MRSGYRRIPRKDNRNKVLPEKVFRLTAEKLSVLRSTCLMKNFILNTLTNKMISGNIFLMFHTPGG